MNYFRMLALWMACLAYTFYISWDEIKLEKGKQNEETFPSEATLKLVSLSYKNLSADYYWFRTLSYFGSSEGIVQSYVNLVPLVQRVVALDPDFASVYTFSGAALTVRELDPKYSVEILEQGTTHRPDLWSIWFYLGFNAYYFMHDYPKAARALARAATIDGAPEISGPLATRLAAQAGEPEIGLALIDTLINEVDENDADARQLIEDRRNLLQVEVDLKELNRQLATYRQTHPPPQSLEELMRLHIVPNPPSDAAGGTYRLREDGQVDTTTKRLELPKEIINAVKPRGD